MAFYLRTENNKIEFLVDDIHEIKNSDMELSNEEYGRFFDLQSEGKQFRLKEMVTYSIPSSLFDYVEEFVNDPVPAEEVTTETTTVESLMSEIEALKNEIQGIKTNLNLS